MARSTWLILLTTLSLTALHAPRAGAVATPRVRILFNGTFTGSATAYTLGAGELDQSASFARNGSATVSGGVADIPGNLDPVLSGSGNVAGLGTTTGSGFHFNAAFLGLGALTAQNWISEARVQLDTAVASQPATFNHILDVQGDTFLRFDGTPKTTKFGYWDGSSEQILPSVNLPATGYSHVGLVWDAAGTNLRAYVNGVLQGTVNLNAFDVPSPRVGYGYFARFFNRAIDGKLDSVAFSTYTGTFAVSDFQLGVPEPSSVALVAAALGVLPWLRRRS